MPDLTPAEQRTADEIDEATCTCGHGVYLHHPTGSCSGQNYGPPEEGFPRLPACECDRSLGVALLESRVLAADQAQTATTITDDEEARLRAVVFGPAYEPDWDGVVEVVEDLIARHAPAADHTATLNRVRKVIDEYFDLDADPWQDDSALPEPEDVWRFHRDVCAALDGDTDQCGDPTRDDEHGGGA